MIVTRKLTKIYPEDVRALSNISIVIPDGAFVFLVGPNGAGKTTLIRMLIREEEATSGSVIVSARNVAELAAADLAEHRRSVGAVFQDARLVGSKTVRENVALPLETDGRTPYEVLSSTQDALETAGIEDLADRFPDDLSGGQQQKCAVARALANKPSAILADEPTGNLSPTATAEIMELFDHINSRGITVVVATHNYDVVDQMGRRVLAIDRGAIVADVPHSRYPDFLRQDAA